MTRMRLSNNSVIGINSHWKEKILFNMLKDKYIKNVNENIVKFIKIKFFRNKI